MTEENENPPAEENENPPADPPADPPPAEDPPADGDKVAGLIETAIAKLDELLTTVKEATPVPDSLDKDETPSARPWTHRGMKRKG